MSCVPTGCYSTNHGSGTGSLPEHFAIRIKQSKGEDIGKKTAGKMDLSTVLGVQARRPGVLSPVSMKKAKGSVLCL